jgi:ubiquinone/menaquinone biosynthesis C-methylase UbiE
MNQQPTSNRYANDWNRYSAEWAVHYGKKYQHLGDEWHDDGSGVRTFEQRLFTHTIEPWLHPNSRVLEIGPGGGKWTVRIAPRVRQLTVFDVAQGMLDRTRARVDAEGIGNVAYVLGNGRDMAQIPSSSIDLVFSYDVFVHIALEDTVAYVAEIARILRDGGMAIMHHAVADMPSAWDRIEEHNEWYRQGRNTLGQFYYYSQDALDRLYTRHGLRIQNSYGYYCTTTLTIVKPADSIVPRLEQALRDAARATDAPALDMAAGDIAGAADDLVKRLAPLTDKLRTTLPGSERFQVLQQIRRLVRG